MKPKTLRKGEHAEVTHPDDGSFLYEVTVLDVKGDRVTLGFEDGVRVTVKAFEVCKPVIEAIRESA